MSDQTSIRRHRVQHYIPKPQYRSADASTHVHTLMEALNWWIDEALAGGARERLTAPNSKLISRSRDTIRCDLAAALAEATEWDGALIAHLLANRGWPVDVELVRTVHHWSCTLINRIMIERRFRADRFNR